MIPIIVKAIASPITVIVLGLGIVTTAAVTQVSVGPMPTPQIIYVTPTPSVPQPSEPLPSEEPSTPPSAVPSAEATDIEVDVDIPPLPTPIPLPIATPAPVIIPPPLPTPCFQPGNSGGGNHVGWTRQDRDCAGRQDSTPLLLAFLALILLWKITDAGSSAPCAAVVGGKVCGMPENYPMHGGAAKWGTDTPNPKYQYHAYDPGERRRLVRRMTDRIARIKDVNG